MSRANRTAPDFEQMRGRAAERTMPACKAWLHGRFDRRTFCRAGTAREATMHQVPREDQLELADAIAEGARRRPSQAFGEYFSETGGFCAPRRAPAGGHPPP